MRNPLRRSGAYVGGILVLWGLLDGRLSATEAAIVLVALAPLMWIASKVDPSRSD